MCSIILRQAGTEAVVRPGRNGHGSVSLKILLSVTIVSVVLLLPWRSAAQVIVQTSSPAQNSVHVDPSVSIAISFSNAIDPATVTGATCVLAGSVRGYYTHSSSYDIPTRVLTVTPDTPFLRGEEITVICTAAIQSAAGPPITPHMFSFSVAYATGGASFIPYASSSAGVSPSGLGLADLDGDGDADVIVADAGSATVLVYENTGAGLLQRSAVSVGAQPQASQMAAGDFDRDGDLDLAIPCSGAGRIFYVWNDGAWSFHTSSYYIGGQPTGIAAGDMDRDGDLDLVVTNRYNMKLMRNMGTGLFTVYSTTLVGGTPYSADLADIDGDGDLDVAVTRNTAGMVVFYRNTGLGGLQYVGAHMVGSDPKTVESCDLDGDGDMDFIIANSGSNSVSMLANDGSGNFNSTTIPVSGAQQRALPCDVDGDGDADLLLSSGVVLFNDGAAAFTPASVGLAPGIPAAGDFDGDGDADVAMLEAGATTIRIYRNDVSNTPPMADAGADFTAACGSSCCSATVTLDGGASSDPDSDPLTYTWLMDGVPVAGPSSAAIASLTLSPGTYLVTLRVADPDGAMDTDDVTVQVIDVTPPQISVLVSPSVLWPPNHQLQTVTAGVSVTDNCGASFTLLSVSSNEAEHGLGKKDKGDDIQEESPGTPDTQFELRAEREGNSARVYTVIYRAIDAAGNSALGTATVTVPHDMAKNVRTGEALPDGLSLAQNFPNPFNTQTQIAFSTGTSAPVRLEIFDLYGRRVAALVDDVLDAGSYSVLFDAAGLPSGTYLCRLQSGRTILSRRLTRMK